MLSYSKKDRWTGWLDMLLLLIVVGGFGWLLLKVKVNLQYSWNWDIIPQYLLLRDTQSGSLVPGLILQGLLVTIRVSIWASGLALLIGIIMGLFRVSNSRLRRFIGWLYVELIRNMPILVWVFIVYYFLSDQLFPVPGSGIPDHAGIADDPGRHQPVFRCPGQTAVLSRRGGGTGLV